MAGVYEKSLLARNALEFLKKFRDDLTNQTTFDGIYTLIHTTLPQLKKINEDFVKLTKKPIYHELYEMGKELFEDFELSYDNNYLDYLNQLAWGEVASEPISEAKTEKDVFLFYVSKILPFFRDYDADSKSLASVALTEKEFMSEKLPKDVADRIASYLSGKKGAVAAQLSQIAVSEGKPGVSTKKGGRKTKKKRSSKKKTHGRRV